MAGTTQYFGISYPTATDYVKDGASNMQTIATGFDTAVAIPTYNNQTGTTYTFVLADAAKTVTSNNASAVTFTIPPQSSVAWATGTTLTVRNLGAGVVTFAGGSGVTVTNTASTVAQYGSAKVVRTGSDAWTVLPDSGDGVSNDIISRIPTSVAVGSGTGSFNSTTGNVTFTGATSISVNGVFNSTYDKYLLICNAGVSTGSVNAKLRFRTSGTDNTASSYSNAIARVSSANSLSTVAIDENIDYVQAVFDFVPSNGNYQNLLKMEILNPFQSLVTNGFIDATVANSTTAYINRRFGACLFNNTTSFDGFTIYSTSAMTGTLKVMAYV